MNNLLFSLHTLEVRAHIAYFWSGPSEKTIVLVRFYNQQYQGTSLWSLTSRVRRFYLLVVILGFKP